MIWSAGGQGEEIYHKIVGVQEGRHDRMMVQNVWVRYHPPIVLPRFWLVTLRFWLVILSALLIQHDIEMTKEGGAEEQGWW